MADPVTAFMRLANRLHDRRMAQLEREYATSMLGLRNDLEIGLDHLQDTAPDHGTFFKEANRLVETKFLGLYDEMDWATNNRFGVRTASIKADFLLDAHRRQRAMRLQEEDEYSADQLAEFKIEAVEIAKRLRSGKPAQAVERAGSDEELRKTVEGLASEFEFAEAMSSDQDTVDGYSRKLTDVFSQVEQTTTPEVSILEVLRKNPPPELQTEEYREVLEDRTRSLADAFRQRMALPDVPPIAEQIVMEFRDNPDPKALTEAIQALAAGYEVDPLDVRETTQELTSQFERQSLIAKHQMAVAGFQGMAAQYGAKRLEVLESIPDGAFEAIPKTMKDLRQDDFLRDYRESVPQDIYELMKPAVLEFERKQAAADQKEMYTRMKRIEATTFDSTVRALQQGIGNGSVDPFEAVERLSSIPTALPAKFKDARIAAVRKQLLTDGFVQRAKEWANNPAAVSYGERPTDDPAGPEPIAKGLTGQQKALLRFLYSPESEQPPYGVSEQELLSWGNKSGFSNDLFWDDRRGNIDLATLGVLGEAVPDFEEKLHSNNIAKTKELVQELMALPGVGDNIRRNMSNVAGAVNDPYAAFQGLLMARAPGTPPFMHDPGFAEIPVQERTDIVNQARLVARRERAAEQRLGASERTQEYDAFMSRLASGAAGLEDMPGHVNPVQRLQAEELFKRVNDVTVAAHTLTGMLSANLPIDGSSKAVQEGADQLFAIEGGQAQLRAMDPGYSGMFVANYTRIGYVPKAARRQVTNMFTGGNAAETAYAADLLVALQRSDPRVFQAYFGDYAARVVGYALDLDTFGSQERTVAQLLALRDPVYAERREGMKAQFAAEVELRYGDQLFPDDDIEDIHDTDDLPYHVVEQMRENLEELAQQAFFENGGRLPAARSTAEDIVSQRWGPSPVGEPVYVMFPPLFTSPMQVDEADRYIRSELDLPVEAEYSLVGDGETPRRGHMVYVNVDGAILPAMDENGNIARVDLQNVGALRGQLSLEDELSTGLQELLQ